MFVIVTYDVSNKRVVKVMKICRKYLTHTSIIKSRSTFGESAMYNEHIGKWLKCVVLKERLKIGRPTY